MATFTTRTPGVATTVDNQVSIDNSRRIYNFGNRVAELKVTQSPFFTYLSKVSKEATDDPVFKMLEQRHQWQRRNFYVKTKFEFTASATAAFADFSPATGDELVPAVKYDIYGKEVATAQFPKFLLPGQVITVEATADFTGTDATPTPVRVTLRVTKVTDPTGIEASVLSIVNASTGKAYAAGDFTDSAGTLTYDEEDKALVTGSAFAQATGAPDGWSDKMYPREGYCQIFKTAIKLFSGSAISTKYRGVENEFMRQWKEKLMEHKMDIEHALLYGVGYTDETEEGSITYTWGILPYIERFGTVYSVDYTADGYDKFLEIMEDFLAPEKGGDGSKLVLASRKILTYMNKLGSNGFLNNTVGTGSYDVDITKVPGKFGHKLTKVETTFGDLYFVQEPLLRGLFEDYAIVVDLANVKYKYLAGNGKSRDTFIKTNVQDNDMDGRKDMILTEAGLWVGLPETHCLLKFHS